MPFGDRGALVKDNSMVRVVRALCSIRMSLAEEEPPQDLVGCVGRRGAGTGHCSAWLVPSAPVPTVSQALVNLAGELSL